MAPKFFTPTEHYGLQGMIGVKSYLRSCIPVVAFSLAVHPALMVACLRFLTDCLPEPGCGGGKLDGSRTISSATFSSTTSPPCSVSSVSGLAQTAEQHDELVMVYECRGVTCNPIL